MVERYFQKFPVISYSNTQVVDITRKAVLLSKVSANPYVYYPYEIVEEERADQFSARYYEDSYQSWVLYITNNITDPYYEWYLSEQQLVELCDKKYGSYFLAEQKIKFYRNDWEGKGNIDVSAYNALTVGMKKYWEPVYGSGSNVVAYKRKENEWTINTNKITSYSVSNTSFVTDEICNIVFNNNYSGTGQVQSVNGNTLFVQHLSGTFLSNSSVAITGSSYIYGEESGVNTAFSSTTLVANNIPSDEENYWAPVTYYDYEREKNEFNKTIRVLEKNFSQQISDNLKDLMKV
jgi:hypothetical protein